MLNYDAFVRLIELHSRRSEAASSAHGSSRLMRGVSSSSAGPWSSKMTGVADGGEAGGAVGGGGGFGGGGLSKEKAMKVWLLEQPLFSSRGLNR